MISSEDEKYMARALELARRGIGYTRPNPMVGAVLVKNGRVIGEGWHGHFGGPHAEVAAFASCREDPAGATLYVTLEPCAHYGKTPPCADLIARKKVARVVCAMIDPNPLVAGKGVQKLRAAGIAVDIGALSGECRLLNEKFLKFVTQKKPFVLYKAAMSLDGKTACYSGESKWISSETSRAAARRLRGEYAAILCGIGTILADDPQLTARTEGLPDPVRLVADSKLRIPLTAKVLNEPGRTILLTTSAAPEEKRKALEEMGVEILACDGERGEVSLKSAFPVLGAMGIDSILLEGGATLAAGALEEGVVDKVLFYIAPLLLGGKHALTPLAGLGALTPAAGVKLSHLSAEKSGEDLAVTGYVEKISN